MLPKPILSIYTDPGLVEPSTRRARFWQKINRSGDGCWPWKGARHELGYGIVAITLDRLTPIVRLYAHRVAWVLHNSRDIPDGMVVDHTCGNKACCNPDHLEVVTQTVNVERYHLVGQPRTCKRGHAIERGKRCGECARIRVAAWYAAHPDKRREQQRRYDLKRGKTGRTWRSARRSEG